MKRDDGVWLLTCGLEYNTDSGHSPPFFLALLTNIPQNGLIPQLRSDGAGTTWLPN
jgi:hypothetical protein